MLNPIKKLFQTAEVNVNQNNEAISLSEKELQAIVGAGVRNGAMWTDPF